MDEFAGIHRFEQTAGGFLPPGFRFHPTDEELIAHYLLKKVLDSNFSSSAIAEADLNKSEPWELPEKAKMGEKEWYFFSLRDRKYPTGLRTNRATERGYWKATGKDREIFSSKTNSLVGMKKTLVFYNGRAPKGLKTNWVMHEFRLSGRFAYHFLSTTSKDEWVISKVFKKSNSGNSAALHGGALKKTRVNGSGQPIYPDPNSPPPLLDSSPHAQHVTCFSTVAPANSPAPSIFSGERFAGIFDLSAGNSMIPATRPPENLAGDGLIEIMNWPVPEEAEFAWGF